MTPSDDLNAALEAFLGSGAEARPPAFAALVRVLSGAIKAGEFDAAASALCRAALPDLDYASAQSLHRLRGRLRGKTSPPAQTARIAVLGSFTTNQLTALLELYLFAAGVGAELYESDYGVFRQEVLDPGSGLYAFKPRTVYLATGWRDLSHCPDLADDRATVEERLEAEWADWSALWQALHERLGCQIIQNNFAPPPWRLLANHEMQHPAGLAWYIARVNAMLADRAPPFVTVHDADHLSASAGRRAWGDERFHHHAKLPCAPAHLVDYAHSVASLLAAQMGLAKKCLVMDLDNTLWGGIIGDDGLGGIRLGQGTPEGEAYLAVQRYAQGLRRRGIILAVCSKNEDAIAREVFEKHTEMVLRMDDIACFVANWGDKAANLRQIADRLNIGLGSLVMLDDSPAERSLIRQLAPEVAVPELPDDPAGFVEALERHRYFQVVSVGQEDFHRADYYRANVERDQAEAVASNVGDFLRSLRMVARVAPINAQSLERSVQLISRSNQFNLTTRRYSAAEVQAMIDDPAWITRTVALADRFGDNGIISVLLARVDGDALELDTWLMSCRVFKRGVEHFLMNHVVEVARARGLKTIRGRYLPTAKNGLVRDHYAELGFTQVGADADGGTRWQLAVTDDWTPIQNSIEEAADA